MISAPSPHRSSRNGHSVGMVVIHGDAGLTDAGTVSWITDGRSRVSYHYLVGRDGECYQFVPDALKAWHAGRSEWAGMTVVGNRGTPSVNDRSLGVALANDGSGSEQYQRVQYHAAAKLVASLCERHGIGLHLIRSHAEVSPGRKTDPWPWFDWPQFFGLLGMYATGRAPNL